MIENIFFEFAPAKLNLFLHVTGRRADGYHLLDSLVAFADLGDRLQASAHDTSPEISLSISGPFAPMLSGENAGDNLVMRAATALQRRFSISRGAHLTLQKNLPLGAGLGGGSADAAAALRMLSRLWGIPADENAWREIASALGSDIPACLHATPQRMRGAGEELEAAALPAGISAVIVHPGAPLATAAVYGALSPPYGEAPTSLPCFTDCESLAEWLKLHTRNDLQGAAMRLLPVICDVIAAIDGHSGCLLARMTGSGSACFGLFDTIDSARAAAAEITRQHPQWWSRAAILNKEGGADADEAQ